MRSGVEQTLPLEQGVQALMAPVLTCWVDRARRAAARVVSDGSDSEAVHDLRVGIRRLRVALRVAGPLYPAGRARAAARALARHATATGALRDAEVLADTLAMADLDRRQGPLAAWLDRQRAAQGALRAEAAVLLASPDLDQAFGQVQGMADDPCAKELSRSAFSQRAISAAVEAVDRLLPVTATDAAALHRLRIRFKRLRYTAELLCALGADVDGRLEGLANQAKRMQTLLGRWHDADQAHRTLDVARDLDEPVRVEALAALARLRARLVADAVGQLATLDLTTPVAG